VTYVIYVWKVVYVEYDLYEVHVEIVFKLCVRQVCIHYTYMIGG
jgi:hypothetical protein